MREKKTKLFDEFNPAFEQHSECRVPAMDHTMNASAGGCRSTIRNRDKNKTNQIDKIYAGEVLMSKLLTLCGSDGGGLSSSNRLDARLTRFGFGG